MIKRVLADDIPESIPRIQFADITDQSRLDGPVYTVPYCGKRHALKAHESVFQNHLFRVELFARVKLGDVPHVAKLVGVIVQNDMVDKRSYVVGMLLRYCEKTDLKFILQHSDPPVEWSRKERWAAQIAHGVIEIQKKGVMHGDLRCANIVIDQLDDAYIIDIVNGQGGMEGWTSVLDVKTDPSRDVYGFGVTLWEIICDGKDPSHPLETLKHEEMDQLVKECVIEQTSNRTHIHHEFDMLGGRIKCGCSSITYHRHI